MKSIKKFKVKEKNEKGCKTITLPPMKMGQTMIVDGVKGEGEIFEREKDPLVLNLKEKYGFKCHACGDNSQFAVPSLFMQTFQINTGGGSCLKCNASMMLRIDEKNEEMISIPNTEENISTAQLPDACYIRKSKKILKKYVCFGGDVVSATDHQTHYIPAERLADLYQVSPEACYFVNATDPASLKHRKFDGLIRLFPRSDGKYNIENAQ